jgi:ABC-type antimicrobial peptide transport system permease subunit
VLGSSLVERMIKAMVDLGLTGSIVQITPGLIAYSVAGALVLGFFGGLYPAWRASSMHPVEAINRGA